MASTITAYPKYLLYEYRVTAIIHSTGIQIEKYFLCFSLGQIKKWKRRGYESTKIVMPYDITTEAYMQLSVILILPETVKYFSRDHN
jgi:hypothetical protein